MSIYPMYTRKITHWFARRSFQNRIFLLILFTSTIVMLAMSWYLTDITDLHYQVGQRALIQAMQISAMPELVEAVQKRDLARIKALIDPMRSFSDATYITVGDASGQRLYHVNPDEIWQTRPTSIEMLKATCQCAKARWDRRCAVNRRFRTQPAR